MQKINKLNQIITIDGAAATGKSGCGAKLAAEIKFSLLDTGFYYRYLTWLAIKFKVDLNQIAKNYKIILNAAQNNYYYDLHQQRMFHCQKDITKALFTMDIIEAINYLSVEPEIRKFVTNICRKEAEKQNTILVGRDCGSNIAKNADIKFFLTVNKKTQQLRRIKQFGKSVDEAIVIKNLRLRDENDQNRKLNPAKPTSDSIIIDTSNLKLDEAVDLMLGKMKSILIKKLPQIILLGPSNVGKSTIFNRLINQNNSLVTNKPFTTRDLVKQQIAFETANAILIDSGGMIAKQTKIEIHELITKQNQSLFEQIEIFILVFDINFLFTEKDFWYLKQIKKFQKPIIVVLNKSDLGKNYDENLFSYQKLGIKDLIVVSARERKNLGSLKKIINQYLIKNTVAWQNQLMQMPFEINIGIFGQTNVGKSTLFNALIQKKIAFVSSKEHTTTNTVKHTVLVGANFFTLVDTAGLRRKVKKMSLIEKEASQQTYQSLKMIDVALLLIDGSKSINEQDQRIANTLLKQVPTMLIVNKSDLIKRQPTDAKILRYFPQLPKNNILFVNSLKSASNGKIWNHLLQIYQEKTRTYDVEKIKFLLKMINLWLFKFNSQARIYNLNYANGVFVIITNENTIKNYHLRKIIEKQIQILAKFKKIKPYFIYKNKKSI